MLLYLLVDNLILNSVYVSMVCHKGVILLSLSKSVSILILYIPPKCIVDVKININTIQSVNDQFVIYGIRS